MAYRIRYIPEKHIRKSNLWIQICVVLGIGAVLLLGSVFLNEKEWAWTKAIFSPVTLRTDELALRDMAQSMVEGESWHAIAVDYCRAVMEFSDDRG